MASTNLIEHSRQAAAVGRPWTWDDHRRLLEAEEEIAHTLKFLVSCALDSAHIRQDPQAFQCIVDICRGLLERNGRTGKVF
ncbi:MAG: hypothetical protein ACT4O3_05755 [Elusimicrobiota bacterium]